MRNKSLYLLFILATIGFTSCQKAPYATFQKSQSETFAKKAKTQPAIPITIEAKETPTQDVMNQVPASSITASISDDISFDEPASLFSTTETAPVEEAVAPVAATPTPKVAVASPVVTNLSGKSKLLNKFVAKRINKLNKKAEKSNSSAAVASGSLLYIGLVVLAIGLLLTLVPVANALSGIVIAAGAIIAIIGLLQRIL